MSLWRTSGKEKWKGLIWLNVMLIIMEWCRCSLHYRCWASFLWKTTSASASRATTFCGRVNNWASALQRSKKCEYIVREKVIYECEKVIYELKKIVINFIFLVATSSNHLEAIQQITWSFFVETGWFRKRGTYWHRASTTWRECPKNTPTRFLKH